MNKKGIILSMMVIVFVIAVTLAGTMAWFTAGDSAEPASFQAGTVEIDAGDTYTISGEDYQNVNPGDCFVLCWDFENTGTKQIELRTEINPVWVDQDGTVLGLSIDNVYILPQYQSNWVLYEEEGSLWAYYLGGPVGSGETVSLCLVVFFDGELTGNDYQGQIFRMRAEVEAVQASNDAPSEVWGAAWDEVTAEGYGFNYTTRWPGFDLEKIYCFTGEENGGTVNYGEHYVGFEDATDFDYSDFGMAFTLTENYNSEQELESITMVFNALSYTADHNHYIRLDHTGLTGDYSYDINRAYTIGGSETPGGTYVSTNDPLEDVIIFDTNRYTKGLGLPINDSVTIELTLDDPISLGAPGTPRAGLDVDDLDPALYYYNFSMENLNTDDTYNMSSFEANYGGTEVNVPRIIVVPEPGFIPPADTVPMNTAYPEFNDYYGGNTAYSNWYENPDNGANLAWSW